MDSPAPAPPPARAVAQARGAARGRAPAKAKAKAPAPAACTWAGPIRASSARTLSRETSLRNGGRASSQIVPTHSSVDTGMTEVRGGVLPTTTPAPARAPPASTAPAPAAACSSRCRRRTPGRRPACSTPPRTTCTSTVLELTAAVGNIHRECSCKAMTHLHTNRRTYWLSRQTCSRALPLLAHSCSRGSPWGVQL